jgi:hypothetical protein
MSQDNGDLQILTQVEKFRDFAQSVRPSETSYVPKGATLLTLIADPKRAQCELYLDVLEIRPDKATPVCRSDARMLGTQSFPRFVENCSTF